MPDLPPLDVGYLTVFVVDDRLHIDSADKLVWWADELVAATLTHPTHPDVTADGGIITIVGDDRTVRYRLTGQTRPGWQLAERQD